MAQRAKGTDRRGAVAQSAILCLCLWFVTGCRQSDDIARTTVPSDASLVGTVKMVDDPQTEITWIKVVAVAGDRLKPYQRKEQYRVSNARRREFPSTPRSDEAWAQFERAHNELPEYRGRPWGNLPPEGAVEADIDSAGRFAFGHLPAGDAYFQVHYLKNGDTLNVYRSIPRRATIRVHETTRVEVLLVPLDWTDI